MKKKEIIYGFIDRAQHPEFLFRWAIGYPGIQSAMLHLMPSIWDSRWENGPELKKVKITIEWEEK